jgi:hypothetical protein
VNRLSDDRSAEPSPVEPLKNLPAAYDVRAVMRDNLARYLDIPA